MIVTTVFFFLINTVTYAEAVPKWINNPDPVIANKPKLTLVPKKQPPRTSAGAHPATIVASFVLQGLLATDKGQQLEDAFYDEVDYYALEADNWVRANIGTPVLEGIVTSYDYAVVNGEQQIVIATSNWNEFVTDIEGYFTEVVDTSQFLPIGEMPLDPLKPPSFASNNSTFYLQGEWLWDGYKMDGTYVTSPKIVKTVSVSFSDTLWISLQGYNATGDIIHRNSLGLTLTEFRQKFYGQGLGFVLGYVGGHLQHVDFNTNDYSTLYAKELANTVTNTTDNLTSVKLPLPVSDISTINSIPAIVEVDGTTKYWEIDRPNPNFNPNVATDPLNNPEFVPELVPLNDPSAEPIPTIVPNPEYVPSAEPMFIPNPSYNAELEPSIENPAYISNPNYNPENVPEVDPTADPDFDPITGGPGGGTSDPPTDSGGSSSFNMRPLTMVGDTLKGKFPFSIPWDVFSLFSVLNVEPITPVFEIASGESINIGGKSIAVNYDFDINFSFFDPIAKIIRWGLILVFDIAIVLALRRITPD